MVSWEYTLKRRWPGDVTDAFLTEIVQHKAKMYVDTSIFQMSVKNLLAIY